MERKDVIKMDTIIKVKCIDQTLTLINSPVIASGGLNENKLECEFCEKWDGFSKTAVFYQDKKNVYYSVLDENDTCVIPKEATASKGTMCFGIAEGNFSYPLQSIVANEISERATYNGHELISEGFVEYLGKDESSELSKKVYNCLVKKWKKR